MLEMTVGREQSPLLCVKPQDVLERVVGETAVCVSLGLDFPHFIDKTLKQDQENKNRVMCEEILSYCFFSNSKHETVLT